MPKKTTTHNFNYSPEDIEDLIKADIAEQLGMKTLPIIDYKIDFRIVEENHPGDTFSQFPSITVFKGAKAFVEIL
jgi:hypothetical protein